MWLIKRWLHQIWQRGYDKGLHRGWMLGCETICDDCPFSDEAEGYALTPPLSLIHRQAELILEEKNNEH